MRPSSEGGREKGAFTGGEKSRVLPPRKAAGRCLNLIVLKLLFYSRPSFSKACRRSSRMSSASSIPTLKRKNPP